MIKKIIVPLITVLVAALAQSTLAIDQCNSTEQCQNIFGPSATDCADSRSDTSVCMCGSAPCDAPPPPTSNQSAYADHDVPGRIEAEAYDLGGQGIAYNDDSDGNTGGQFRGDDVDIEVTSDAGGGHNVGWIENGEWLEYTLDDIEVGTYDIHFRLAALGTSGGKSIRAELAGVDLGTVNFSGTDGWQEWKTFSLSNVRIAGGSNQVLRLSISGGDFNINWLEFESTGTPPPPPPSGQSPFAEQSIPGRIQAENYDNGGQGVAYNDVSDGNSGSAYRNDDVDIQSTSDNGGGHNVGWVANGEWLEYTLANVRAGNYDIRFRLSANSTAGGKGIEVGLDNANLGTLNFNGTGSWQNWQTFTLRDIAVSGGSNKVLRLNMNGGAFNINWLEFGDVSAPPPPPPSGGMLGLFEKGTDLWLANYDNKPDPDDIHSQAAAGTMLVDPRFSGVDVHAVMGTIGQQGGRQLDSSSLFDMVFGSNWSNAVANRDRALDDVTDKVLRFLDNGGDIWVTEAGQADFTADLVRRIKSQRSSVDTESRIHVIQHSGWNQDRSTPSDLSYVRNNTDYKKINDGNSGGNGTPDFAITSGSQWSKAQSMPRGAGEYWREARRLADRAVDEGSRNPSISAGGFDFSDAVEVTHLFGFNDDIDSVTDFFNQFD